MKRGISTHSLLPPRAAGTISIIKFKARFKMLPFAGNYGKDRKFSHSEWLCKCGEEKEQESHLLAGRCKVYGNIRAAGG